MESNSPGCLPFLAAAVGAAITAVAWFEFELSILVLPFALAIAAAHIAFLAVPIYFWLERRYRPTLAVVLLAATLIGALPVSLLLGPTAAWQESLLVVGMCGSCGFVGGLAFWLVLKFGEEPIEKGRPD